MFYAHEWVLTPMYLLYLDVWLGLGTLLNASNGGSSMANGLNISTRADPPPQITCEWDFERLCTVRHCATASPTFIVFNVRIHKQYSKKFDWMKFHVLLSTFFRIFLLLYFIMVALFFSFFSFIFSVCVRVLLSYVSSSNSLCSFC